MQERNHSSASKSYNSQNTSHFGSPYDTYTPNNTKQRGFLNVNSYDSNPISNYSTINDTPQSLDYVPNISLNLMDIAVSPQNVGSYASTPQRTPLKSHNVSYSAQKDMFTAQKKDTATQKHYTTKARSMSAAKAYHTKASDSNSSGKSTYASILSRESKRKSLLNQSHDYRLYDFKLYNAYPSIEGMLDTSFGATSKSPGRGYGSALSNPLADQMSGTAQFTKPPAYRHREKNELYERIIEKILQKENIEPGKPSHLTSHHRANTSLNGSCQNRSRSNTSKYSILSASSRKETLENLKGVNILDSDDIQQDTKIGLVLIKTSIAEALDEKKSLEGYIFRLREEIHALKEDTKSTEKNQTVLRNQAVKLFASNERLDRHTTDNQNNFLKVKQEILNFQANVTSNQEKVEALERQIKEEQNLIEIHKLTAKSLKNYIIEETKDKEVFKEAVIQSRRAAKRQLDELENAQREKQKVLVTIQSQLKYMVQNPR